MKISIVIPAYNEDSNIIPLYNEIKTHIPQGWEYEIIFVDDGSTDHTLLRLKALQEEDQNVRYFAFSRNFGHQNALKCGLDHASGDCVISMDADLQHPPGLIPDMIEKWKDGYDVVYTVRKNGPGIPASKNTSSRWFYRVMNWLSDLDLEEGTADFRLLDAQVVSLIRQQQEAHLFLRGYISWVGFRQYRMEYTASPRFSGVTKYSWRKMISFALHGITSFSIKPLRFSILLGLFISGSAFLYVLYAVIAALFTDWTVPGWASLVVSVQMIGGIQLIILGVIGEYLGKMFLQSKNRPVYIVRESSTEPLKRRDMGDTKKLS